MQERDERACLQLLCLTREPLLIIPVVAKMLAVSRPTVYTLIDTEGLPIIRFGRCVRISPISLQKWLAHHEQEQGA